MLIAALFASAAPLDADELVPLIEALGSEDFRKREAAVVALAEAGDRGPEQLFRALVGEAFKADPESRSRIEGVLRQVYRRQVLGEGQFLTGIRLGSFIWFGPDDQPAFAPVVVEVEAGSAADAAGLAKGDVIWAAGGEKAPAEGAAEWLRAVIARQVGDAPSLTLTVERHAKDPRGPRLLKAGDGRREVELKLAARSPVGAAEFDEERYRIWRAGVVTRYRTAP